MIAGKWWGTHTPHLNHVHILCQWELQDPKMEVLYHIRQYFVGICGDIPLHRPYIGLIYGRYLQFRFLKWPYNMFTLVYRDILDLGLLISMALLSWRVPGSQPCETSSFSVSYFPKNAPFSNKWPVFVFPIQVEYGSISTESIDI